MSHVFHSSFSFTFQSYIVYFFSQLHHFSPSVLQSFPLLPCAPLSLPELQDLVVFMALLIGAAVAFLGI